MIVASLSAGGACTTILGFDKSVESADDPEEAGIGKTDGSTAANPPPSDGDAGTNGRKDGGDDDFDGAIPEDDAGPIVVEPYLDPSFGGEGTGRFRAEGTPNWGKPGLTSTCASAAVVVAADHSIWFTTFVREDIGEAAIAAPSAHLYRIAADGTPDAKSLALPTATTAYRALLADGSGILGLGAKSSSENVVARYTANGGLDPSFGDAGAVSTALLPSGYSNFLGGAFEGASTLRLWGVKKGKKLGDSYGAMDDLFAISFNRTTKAFGSDLATTDGAFQGHSNSYPAFAPAGMYSVNATTFEFFGIHGPFGSGLFRSFGFFRVKDGVPDTSFGTGGLITYDLADEPANWQNRARAGAVVDGKLLILSSYYAYGKGLVSRFSPSGVPDTSFGSGGFSRLWNMELPKGVTDIFGRAMLVMPDKKILVAGSAIVPNGTRAVIMRLDATGKLDTSFAEGGFAMPEMETVATREEALALALEDSGNVIVVGQSENTAGAFNVFAVRLVL